MFGAAFFLIQKLYYHFEFVKHTNRKYKDDSLVDIFINPILALEVFYIFIPIFLVGERRKDEKELALERKITKALVGFWSSIGLSIVVAIVLLGLT